MVVDMSEGGWRTGQIGRLIAPPRSSYRVTHADRQTDAWVDNTISVSTECHRRERSVSVCLSAVITDQLVYDCSGKVVRSQLMCNNNYLRLAILLGQAIGKNEGKTIRFRKCS